MASTYSAEMTIRLRAEEALDATADPGSSGVLPIEVVNATGGRRWTDGGGSGQIEKCYKRVRTISAGATDAYDLLAAGSLTTPAGASIDADELKALVLRVTSGEVKLVGAALNALDCFTAASEGVKLAASGGLRCLALDFGPDGLDVAANSKFEIIETSASATADYELELIVAE